MATDDERNDLGLAGCGINDVVAMRFSIRNMAIWTGCCGCIFAAAQFLGLPVAIILFLLCLLVLRAYEDGLRSAGIKSDRLRNFACDLQSRSDDSFEAEGDAPKMRGRGPALFLMFGGLLGCVFGSWLQGPYDEIAAAMPSVWMVIGGIVFRFRSRDWPVDPQARGRQIGYIVVALIMLPIALVSLGQDSRDRVGFAVIGVVIGATISVGMLVSGRRRQQFADGVERHRIDEPVLLPVSDPRDSSHSD